MKNNELPSTTKVPLRSMVEETLHDYFTYLDPTSPPTSLYDFIIQEVEIPLLEKVLHFTNGNQSKAASMLGISRNTLRRKIIHYELIELKAENT